MTVRGASSLLDHQTFEPRGRWERDRGPQHLAYDFAWHLGHDTLITSEWGTPNMVKDGVESRAPAGGQVRTRAARLGPAQAPPPADPRSRVAAPDGPRAAAGPRPAPGLRLRQRGDLAGGPELLDLALVPRPREHRRPARVEDAQGDHDPGRAGGSGRPAAPAAGLQGGAAARHRHQPVAGRPLALRLLLGHRRAPAVRCERSVPAGARGLGPARRNRAAYGASQTAGPAAQWRSPDGRGEPRRPAGVSHQRACSRRGIGSSTPTGSGGG